MWGFSSVITAVILLLVASVIAVFWILAGIRSAVDARLISSLQAVLDTTDSALRMWAEAIEADVSVLATSEPLQVDVEEQLRVRRDVVLLRASPALEQINRLLAPPVKLYHLAGFAILAPDGVEVAGHIDKALGSTEIAHHNPDLLRQTAMGNVAIGTPYKSVVFSDREGSGRPVITAAAPIRDQSGKVIAALALTYDLRRDFTQMMHLARLETSGETYAFDRKGRFLSESRFENVLKKAGLLSSDEDSILNVEVRDPGGNILEGYQPTLPRTGQPLTRMAESAVNGNAGVDVEGYRDYRGVTVVGAWVWDNRLGMGLATEMDRAEAFANYRRVLRLSILMLLLLVGMSGGLVFLVRHRDRLIAADREHNLAMKARDDMMAIVAHDLRNPLNTMLLRSHIMLQMTEECGGEQSVDLRRNLEKLQGTARHMNGLIGDLTDAARIHAGRLHMELHECLLQVAVEPAIERTRLLTKEKGIEFAAHLPSEPLRILADKARITQVLDNLLGNAMKFTPRGGTITLDGIRTENEARLSVADTGSGIPEDVLMRVFEPYWQVQKTRSGMGLGLFIAKTIIEGHGGRIWVESRVRHGTTFYFTLPCDPTNTLG
jgi:signal transduction histidine kinase